MKRDIVYILKNDISSDEIRYSLRSVCENFPYRKIVFIGGCPEGIEPDLYIQHEQVGRNKWEKVRSSMIKILKCEDISEEFFLFNDDFYVLSPQSEDFINFADGTLDRRITELKQRLGRTSTYTRQLETIQTFLKRQHKDTVNFALHLPLLVNRFVALGLLTSYPQIDMFRSFYGNMAEIEYRSHKDVKIYKNDEMPKFDDYLSTCDDSFRDGAVGVFVRNRFNKPCKYEGKMRPECNLDEIYLEVEHE